MPHAVDVLTTINLDRSVSALNTKVVLDVRSVSELTVIARDGDPPCDLLACACEHCTQSFHTGQLDFPAVCQY